MCPLRAVERTGQMRWWVWKFFANCKCYKIELKDRGPSLWQFPMWKMRMLDQSILDLPGLQDTSLRLSKAETPSSLVSSHWDSWEITLSSLLWIHRCRNQSTKSHGQRWGIPIPSSAPVTVAWTPGRAGVRQLLEGLCPPTKSAGKIGPHWGGLELRRSLPIKCLPFLSPVGQRGFKQHLVCAPHNRAVVVFPWEALDSSVMYHFTSAFPPSLPHFLLSLLLAAPRLHSRVEHWHKSFALGSEF